MLKTFRIVTTDDTGSRTQDIQSRAMKEAIDIALNNLTTKNINSIATVTCTTL